MKNRKPYQVVAIRWDGDTKVVKKIWCETFSEAVELRAKMIKRESYDRINIIAYGEGLL